MNNLIKLLLITSVFFSFAISNEILGQGKVKKTAYVTTTNRPLAGAELLIKVHRIAVENGIPPKLFENLIRQESAGKLNAVSHKGAACLTQLMPATARRLGLTVNAQVDERFNVDKCLSAGARYLRFQLETFKDVRLALAGYNAGEGAVMKYGNRIPPYKETTEYVEKICYMTYGQRGHSIAVAYNQPMAASIVNSIYRSRFYPNSPLELQSVPLPKEPEQVDEENLAQDKNNEEEKPARTKVVLPARIKVSGLFFN